MTTKAIPVRGTTVEWSADGTTYAAFPEVLGIPIPQITQDYIDVTNFDSPGGFREYILGLRDAGEFSFEANYVGKNVGNYATALGYSNNNTLVHFRITFPLQAGQASGDVHAFTAYITPSIQPGDQAGRWMISISCRVTGAPTFTEGAAA